MALSLAGELRAVHLRLALHGERFHDVGIDRHAELVFLHAEEGTTARAPVGRHAADRRAVVVEELLAALARPVGDQVEHATDTLSVVTCAGIGHDLDVFDAAGGHVLEDLGWVAAHHDVGLAVDIDLEAGAAVDRDVIVAVDGHHRHLAQHVEDGIRLGVNIVFDTVAQLIDLHLDQGLLGDDLNTREAGYVVSHINRIEAKRGLSFLDGERDVDVLAAYGGEEYPIVARPFDRLLKTALQIGRPHGDRLLVVVGFIDPDRGEGFALVGEGVDDNALNLDVLSDETCGDERA